MPSQSFEHLVDERKWKVIFSGCVIQLTIVDTYASPSDLPLWDELIFLILYYGHPSLLWDNLDRAYPRTVGDGIDQSSIKEFYDFLFHHLFDIEVNSSLGLDTWFESVFHEDFVST
ncbi:hypothetical protein Tco_0260906, partial [Tanacetum coccineum]